MKRLIASAFLVLSAGLITACGDDTGPTAPAPAVLSLSGSWTGTITYFADPDQSQALCAAERLSTVISQSGAQVTAHIMTTCHGPLEISGRVDGALFTGGLSGASGGRIAGLVSPSRIELTTSRGRTEEPVAVNRIDLVR